MPTRVYIPTEPYTPTGESMYAQPAPDNALVSPPQEQGALSRGINRLLGTQFGEERYQTWPEKMIRSAATLAGDVVSGAVPVLPPGSRREDVTDEPAPGVDSNAPWWKVSRWVPPVAAQPNDVMMERAQDLAGVAMGGGIGGTGKAAAAGEAVLGSGPVRQAAAAAPVKNAPAWYSAVEHALESSTTGAAPGAQWLATLRNSRGVKPEEMAWLGLDDYLAAAQVEGRKVTRAELQDYVKSHAVELKDVEKANRARDYDTMDQSEQGVQRQRLADFLDLTPAEFAREYPTYRDIRDGVNAMLRDFGDEGAVNATKYHDYQLPGGENYREHLITLPSNDINAAVRRFAEKEGISNIREAYQKFDDAAFNKNRKEDYKSSHWDEPNILAHVRTNDRVIDGKKSLHLEEVQSDWHQQGRDRGYKDSRAEKKASDPNRDLTTAEADAARASRNGVPDAPFKKTWHELALKRMLRRAAEEGYERLSWTPGDAQAARYDLSKQIDKLFFVHNTDGTFDLRAQPKGGSTMELGKSVPADKLPDMVGKEMAKKLVEQEKGKGGNFSGLDLKVGGEGMKGFYDQMIPKALEKLTKEHGVKVQKGGVETKPITKTVDDRYSVTGDRNIYNTIEEARKAASEPIFYIDIPQSLRDAAMRKGFPLFSGGKMFVPHQEEDN